MLPIGNDEINREGFIMKSKFFKKKNFQTSVYFTTIGFLGIMLMKNPEYAFSIAAGSIIIGFIFLVIACFEKLITKSKSSLEKHD